MRDLINILDLTTEQIDGLIRIADDIMANREKYSQLCRGKILATLFFEPSTRTRLSFESAMLSLGGGVLGFSEPNSSSAAKGETVADTLEVVSGYADIIAMRHPYEGAPIIGESHSLVPVINAGDGGHYHPTQTLTDLLTIKHEKGHFDGLTIGICGDLKYGRTVHSLISAMSRYEGVSFVLISPEELRLPGFVKHEYLTSKGIEFTECASLDGAIGKVDILYMTRIQRERFPSADEYEQLKDSYILTAEKMKSAKPDMCVLHPLPRVNEIAVEVDSDPRACYFRQAHYGRFVRMALIASMLGLTETRIETGHSESGRLVRGRYTCRNPRCITAVEHELPSVFRLCDEKNEIYRCVYCDAKAY